MFRKFIFFLDICFCRDVILLWMNEIFYLSFYNFFCFMVNELIAPPNLCFYFLIGSFICIKIKVGSYSICISSDAFHNFCWTNNVNREKFPELFPGTGILRLHLGKILSYHWSITKFSLIKDCDLIIFNLCLIW